MIITYPKNFPSGKVNIEIEYLKMDGYHILYRYAGARCILIQLQCLSDVLIKLARYLIGLKRTGNETKTSDELSFYYQPETYTDERELAKQLAIIRQQLVGYRTVAPGKKAQPDDSLSSSRRVCRSL